MDRLDAAFGRPVVLEGGALWEVLLDFVQSDDSASVGGKKFVPNSLDLATEFQVGLQIKEEHVLRTFI